MARKSLIYDVNKELRISEKDENILTIALTERRKTSQQINYRPPLYRNVNN